MAGQNVENVKTYRAGPLRVIEGSPCGVIRQVRKLNQRPNMGPPNNLPIDLEAALRELDPEELKTWSTSPHLSPELQKIVNEILQKAGHPAKTAALPSYGSPLMRCGRPQSAPRTSASPSQPHKQEYYGVSQPQRRRRYQEAANPNNISGISIVQNAPDTSSYVLKHMADGTQTAFFTTGESNDDAHYLLQMVADIENCAIYPITNVRDHLKKVVMGAHLDLHEKTPKPVLAAAITGWYHSPNSGDFIVQTASDQENIPPIRILLADGSIDQLPASADQFTFLRDHEQTMPVTQKYWDGSPIQDVWNSYSSEKEHARSSHDELPVAPLVETQYADQTTDGIQIVKRNGMRLSPVETKPIAYAITKIPTLPAGSKVIITIDKQNPSTSIEELLHPDMSTKDITHVLKTHGFDAFIYTPQEK
jgi:hypothetical protein